MSWQRIMQIFCLLIINTIKAAAVTQVITAIPTMINVADKGFLCADGKTRVAAERLCDGVNDCQGTFMTDECDCANISNDTKSMCEKWGIIQSIFPGVTEDSLEECGDVHDIYECIMHDQLVLCSNNPGTLKCDTPGLCVTKSSFCDDEDCCPDEADERHLGFGLKCAIQGATHSDKCLLPPIHLEDDEDQCLNGAENCHVLDSNGNKTDQLREHCFRCMDRKHVILLEQVCDGILDCSDFSDECLCKPVRTPEICRVMYDENVRYDDECKNGTGDVSCGNGICISKTLVCDGDSISECHGIDEKYCYSEKYRRQLTSESEEKLEIYCNVTEINENKTESKEAVVCDGIPECDSLEDECVEICRRGNEPLPAYCGGNLGCIPGSLVCNGIMESQHLRDCNYTYNAAEEENCPQRFYCSAANGKMISIDITLVCDGVLNCDDGSDEAKERNCTADGRFYCETNDRAPFIDPERPRNYAFFVPRYKVSDGIYDCDDGSDECPKNPDNPQIFNSKTEMIGWMPLRVIMWFNAFVALLGNLIVILYSLGRMIHNGKPKCTLSVTAYCHHILVFNLSLADLLMGVYLIILASKTEEYSGRYCADDKSWRLGNTCTALGVISLVSSEMSVYTMLLMAIFRYNTVKNPLCARSDARAAMRVRILSLVGWIICIVFAVLPLIDPIKAKFQTHAWVKGPMFTHYTVRTDEILELTKKIKTASNRGYGPDLSSISPNSLYGAEEILSKSFPEKGQLEWIGFYGKVSVCLPGLFQTTLDKGWQYSAAIICVNMVAFIVMSVLYGRLWLEARSSRKQVSENQHASIAKTHDQRLMSRISTILLTDFMCWIPICIIFFVYIAGQEIGPVAFAVSGVVLLPINSALNPIIYSGLFSIIKDIIGSTRTRRKGSKTTVTTKAPGNSTQKNNTNLITISAKPHPFIDTLKNGKPPSTST